MKYQKAVPINNSHIELIRAGMMNMQRGQWIQLAWATTPSRWVGVTKAGVLWAVHTYQNSKGKTVMDGGRKRFSTMCNSFTNNS